MTSSEDVETQASLLRLNKVSRVIRMLFKIACIGFCIIWAAMLVFITVLIVSGSGSSGVGLPALILFFVSGLLVAGMLWNAYLIFDDVAKGESPFTMVQVKRIRRVAYILLLYVVFEAVFPAGQSTLMQDGSFQIGYSVVGGTGAPIVSSVNLGMLATGIIFYCLSLVFEYGTLLQKLSDETL